MAIRTVSKRIFLTLSLVVLFVVSLIPTPVYAAVGVTSILPDFASFLQSVYDGDVSRLAGVYAPGIMALPVNNQPDDNAGYVSRREETLTRFALADYFGTIGLLAHNYLAGKHFASLLPGQVVYLVYGDGTTVPYIVAQVSSFQAYEPSNPYGMLRNLETGITYSAAQVFSQFYTGTPHITFQTCIAQGTELGWGRLFVVAIPLVESYAQQDGLSAHFR